MSPAQAAEYLVEPDWAELWGRLKAADDGFETLLRKWREWHFTWVTIDGVDKKKLASSVDGVIALAKLGLMPPRSLTERPPGLFAEQSDDHCWLVTEGRAWRVVGIEDRMLFLDSFGEPRQIDLNKAKWENYCAGHAAALASYGLSTASVD
jgi:hypothetical protein